MAMPMKHRQRLQEDCNGQLVLTIDRDKCLLLYPMQEWELVERELARLSSLHRKMRRLQRLMLGHATELEMDGNGRILLPPPLREFASMEKRIVLIGQGNKFELWDEDTWNKQRDIWLEEEEDDDELPEELMNFRL